jgi:hypothetical protein
MLWSILRFTRLEWIAHKTVSLWHFTVVAQAVVLIQASLLAEAMAYKQQASKLKRLAMLSLKAVAHPSFAVAVVPFQVALLTTIKYTFSSKTAVLEFDSLPVSSLRLNAASCWLSLLCYVCLLGLELVKLVSTTRISSSYVDTSSRFTSYFDVMLKLGTSCLVVMYFFTDAPHHL